MSAEADRHAAILAALDQSSPTPRYLQLAAAIGAQVQRGGLRPGEALPSERELATLTGFARVTVRRAVEELMRRGILSRRHGSGTYVASRIEQPLSVLAGFSEDIRARGGRPGSIWLSRALARPTPAEAMALGIGPDAGVLRLTRVRTADDEPLAIEVAVVPAAILPSPDLVDQSLYAALAARGCRAAHGVQRLQAGLATAEEARRLAIPAGSAILRIERRSFLANGRPVEFTISAYRGDRYDFVAVLKGEGAPAA
ncbi:MAG: GntR family transcriptional regulator [Thalassobaculales bacterium]